MRKIHINGIEILMTSSRSIDDASFDRACKFVSSVDKKLLKIKKASIIILQDQHLNSYIIERMNTDTFTLHVRYEIYSDHVFQIN